MASDQTRSPRDALLLHLLVLRCQAGDEEAFARLFEQFGERTLRYLQGLVGDDADDVQQEVWLGVYRRIGQLATPDAFVTWLYSTTRHRAIDRLRRRRREHELLDELAAEHDAADDAPADTEPDRVDDAALADAIATLPPAQREVLLLRYRDGLSHAELASVVGCSVGTIKSRLHHARRRLQRLLEHA